MSKLAIGIDIGGTNAKFGFADRDGNIVAQSRIKTADFPDYVSFVNKLREELPKLHSLEEVIGIGIGAPNANYHTGKIEYPPNLPWEGITPLVDQINNVIGIPSVMTNDANAAALGEKVYGNAKQMDDFIVITIGTGLGGGVYSNGDLIYGKHGFAGELGHTLVNANGRMCKCGKRGCLETYVSATGIRRTVYKLLADYLEPSILRGISFDDLSTKTISDAADDGDHIAIEAFKYTGRILGMKLADFIVHTDPESIFLLGGLARAGEHIFGPARENMDKYLMPLFRNRNIQLLPSGLKDDDAPILGASSLVWKYLDEEEI